MGYRSDVTALFYCRHEQWPAMKLFVDENFLTVGDLIKDEDLHEFTGKYYRGYKFEVQGWKWYPNYPEVIAFNEFVAKFVEVADDENVKWAYEFARVGEQTDDIEEDQSTYADGLVYVSRSIETSY